MKRQSSEQRHVGTRLPGIASTVSGLRCTFGATVPALRQNGSLESCYGARCVISSSMNFPPPDWWSHSWTTLHGPNGVSTSTVTPGAATRPDRPLRGIAFGPAGFSHSPSPRKPSKNAARKVLWDFLALRFRSSYRQCAWRSVDHRLAVRISTPIPKAAAPLPSNIAWHACRKDTIHRRSGKTFVSVPPAMSMT